MYISMGKITQTRMGLKELISSGSGKSPPRFWMKQPTSLYSWSTDFSYVTVWYCNGISRQTLLQCLQVAGGGGVEHVYTRLIAASVHVTDQLSRSHRISWSLSPPQDPLVRRPLFLPLQRKRGLVGRVLIPQDEDTYCTLAPENRKQYRKTGNLSSSQITPKYFRYRHEYLSSSFYTVLSTSLLLCWGGVIL